MNEVTRILEGAQHGESKVAEELLPLVYGQLRKLAAVKMAREAPGQTLQPTALVHEAWLRLVDAGHQNWENKGHFFAAAAEAMRRILVERARSKHRLRHGGGQKRVELEEADLAVEPGPDEKVLLVHACRGDRRLARSECRQLRAVCAAPRDHRSRGKLAPVLLASTRRRALGSLRLKVAVGEP